MTGYKLYGPYIRADGRKHVIEIINGVRKTTSYPKWLVEQKLGRKLNSDENVHHIDGNFTNDSFDNLQVLSKQEHGVLHAPEAEYYYFVCPVCGRDAKKEARNVRGNHKKGKSGPFCSRKCAGIGIKDC